MKYIVGILCKCFLFLCFLCSDVDSVSNYTGSIFTGWFIIFLHLIASVKLLNKSVLLKLVVNVLLNELSIISVLKQIVKHCFSEDLGKVYMLYSLQTQISVVNSIWSLIRTRRLTH